MLSLLEVEQYDYRMTQLTFYKSPSHVNVNENIKPKFGNNNVKQAEKYWNKNDMTSGRCGEMNQEKKYLEHGMITYRNCMKIETLSKGDIRNIWQYNNKRP